MQLPRTRQELVKYKLTDPNMDIRNLFYTYEPSRYEEQKWILDNWEWLHQEHAVTIETHWIGVSICQNCEYITSVYHNEHLYAEFAKLL